MNKYRITYIGIDGIQRLEEVEFEDTVIDETISISADEWAEDYAYSLADKSEYKVEII